MIKEDTKPYPFPFIGQIKGYFIINISGNTSDSFIIGVILTSEDDGFPLITFNFAFSDEFFFLISDTFEENTCRFIVGVLWYKLTSDCKVKDFRLGELYGGLEVCFVGFNNFYK